MFFVRIQSYCEEHYSFVQIKRFNAFRSVLSGQAQPLWCQMKIATLTTSYNRKKLTLRALSSLVSQKLPENISIIHFLVDDLCTDGTAAAVSKSFPAVNIVSSKGNLFWAGGMRFGWSQAVRQIDYDYIFVYNDDVFLFSNALNSLLETANLLRRSGQPTEHIISGSFLDSTEGSLTYGGVTRSSSWHPLRFSLVKPDSTHCKFVDTVNMNGCLISREAIDRVGFLSDYFIHKCADYEYGLKLRAAGGAAVISPGYVGICDANPDLNINKLPFSQRLKFLLSPKGQPLLQRFLYYSRYGGIFWPFLFLLPYLRLLRF